MYLNYRFVIGIFCVVGSVIGHTDRADAQQIDFSSTATARYQGGVNASQSLSITNPGNLVPVTANAVSDPSQDGFSYAEGRAEGQLNALGATLRSYSYASGFDPNHGPPDEVRAAASATASTSWISQSQTLTSGTPIQINFLVPISGSLSVEEFFGANTPSDVFVDASAELFANGTILYSGSARAYDGANGGIGSTLTTTGTWVGDFTTQATQNGLPDPDAFFINTFDVVSINANLGEMFAVDFILQTSAYSVGPFETLAIADFGSTGSFELSAVDPISGAPIDVTFSSVSVPEPGTAGFCAIAIAIVRLRPSRRRIRTC